ncbi:Villin-1-like protein [Drosera capensis]
MSPLAIGTGSVFLEAGTKTWLEILYIENLRLVPVPKFSQGKFFAGSVYLVLNTLLLKDGTARHDIRYWIGNDATEVDSAVASEKALELDVSLGSCSVHYKEIQGQETEKFLSYFKPCLIPLEEPFLRQQINLTSSLNHNDVFILDTTSKVYLFSGCNSSIQERAKALEVVQYIKEEKHSGKCNVVTIGQSRMENLLAILMLGSSGAYLEVMLEFQGIRLLFFRFHLPCHLCNYISIFKRQGFDVKELSEETNEVYIDCSGNLKVWCVAGDKLQSVPVENAVKLFSGDCYVLQYTYHVQLFNRKLEDQSPGSSLYFPYRNLVLGTDKRRI